jgi:hypothetical protein
VFFSWGVLVEQVAVPSQQPHPQLLLQPVQAAKDDADGRLLLVGDLLERQAVQAQPHQAPVGLGQFLDGFFEQGDLLAALLVRLVPVRSRLLVGQPVLAALAELIDQPVPRHQADPRAEVVVILPATPGVLRRGRSSAS